MDKTVQKNLNNLLVQAKEVLKKSDIDSTFFMEFVDPITICDVNDDVLFIKTKNIFAKQTLSSDYKKILEKEINKINNTNYQLKFVTENEINLTQQASNSSKKVSFDEINTKKPNGVNKNYTFSNFIVSEFNKTAYNAAQTVFKEKFWNPIFISGGVGLGKTHLLHAIGNEYAQRFPNKNIKYISTDDFVREVYNSFSIGGNAVEQLKEKYESYDLLLLDDIQFLEKKEKLMKSFLIFLIKILVTIKLL